MISMNQRKKIMFKIRILQQVLAFVFLLFSLPTNALGQDESHGLMSVAVPYPKPGESMEYRFPKKVTDILNRRMDSVYKRNIWFVIKVNADTVSLSSFQSSEPTSAMRDERDTIFQSTNRHWNYRGWKIPIILRSDQRFSCANFHSSSENSDLLVFICRDWWNDKTCIILSKNWYYSDE